MIRKTGDKPDRLTGFATHSCGFRLSAITFRRVRLLLLNRARELCEPLLKSAVSTVFVIHLFHRILFREHIVSRLSA